MDTIPYLDAEAGPSTTDLPLRTSLEAIEAQTCILPAVSLRTDLVRLILLLATPYGEVEVKLRISGELFRDEAAVRYYLKRNVPTKARDLLIASGRIAIPFGPPSPFLLSPEGIDFTLAKDERGHYKNLNA